MQGRTTTIDVLIERDGDWWVARCLQINVATQARTLSDLHFEIVRIVGAHFDTCAALVIDPFAKPSGIAPHLPHAPEG